MEKAKQIKAKPFGLLKEHVHHLQFLDEKCNSIGPTIRISQEIICLPDAGFLGNAYLATILRTYEYVLL